MSVPPFLCLLQLLPWTRSLIVAERQSALVLDCRVGWGPTSTALAVERGAASIALDVHLSIDANLILEMLPLRMGGRPERRHQ
jgi:hypothetical protein